MHGLCLNQCELALRWLSVVVFVALLLRRMSVVLVLEAVTRVFIQAVWERQVSLSKQIPVGCVGYIINSQSVIPVGKYTDTF